MTVGGRQYNEADLIQMQREAENRVVEMRNRARRTVEESGGLPFPRNRNWSSNPGMNRQRDFRRPQQQARSAPPSPPEPEPAALPEESRPEPVPSPPEPLPKKDGTVVGDIMNALGLDEDYLLIIGLILILVNQRADTTLILALAYLLF